MNQENENEEDLPKLSISQENEFKKMKLGLELGAKFRDFNADKSLPPEIEGHLLDYISKFEKQIKVSKKISIYKKIGKPVIHPMDILEDQDVVTEIKIILKLLKKNNIFLDIIFEKQTDPRALYEFLTTDFYDFKINDIRVAGMQTCFIYEDFRPNHACMLEQLTKRVVKSFLNKDSKTFKKTYKKGFDLDNELINFRKSFFKFKLQSLQILKIHFDNETAQVDFDIEFWAKPNEYSEKMYFSGLGFVRFNLVLSIWEPHFMFFPNAEL